ncbi:M14 family zinc carboxypeptidase [Eisenibacter elegans]|uniref:M14 family zinc carboxypeptidase n=1 Tax=Eisenibacter elegans TaxID=997 RepID=UPI0004183657|nr:M14 family zinc carboxypeptidase [Eisenibacter elegans]
MSRFLHHFLGWALILCLTINTLNAQSLLSPDDFLGYPLGQRFTPHHRVVAYFEHVAERSPSVVLEYYGQTYEGRLLIAAFVGAEPLIQSREDIRLHNRIITGLDQGSAPGQHRPIIWLSYNIHGNEASGTEAAMRTLYTLASAPTAEIQAWLGEMLVVIDPCENPDGRDRYAIWHAQAVGKRGNGHIAAWEHHEPWPGGRFNHYIFDLNRDWAWQTQQESRARTRLIGQWMPHVHVDFHEMGVFSQYFFPPSASPYHPALSDWQREFPQYLGETIAQYFDQSNQLYFTKEVFDLFYPSYGDTWPSYQGALGYTYEQSGSGRGSTATYRGQDTLTLERRLNNHHEAGMATLRAAYTHRQKILQEFANYFKTARQGPKGDYRSFVVKGTNDTAKLRTLLRILDGQQIQYAYSSSGGSGWDYKAHKMGSFAKDEGDIVISTAQPQGHLAKILFEPVAALEDSITYDLTAWALPYALGLEAYASKGNIGSKKDSVKLDFEPNTPTARPPYAFAFPWKATQQASLLAACLEAGLNLRTTTSPFEIEDQTFERGTMLLTQADNRHLDPETFANLVISLANKAQQPLKPLYTGLVSKGRDLGASGFPLIRKSNVAIVGGDGVAPTSFGEIWHYFEEQVSTTVTVLQTNYLGSVDLREFDVIVLPSGNYRKHSEQLLAYIHQGGRVVALERSIELFAQAQETQLAQAIAAKESAKQNKDKDKPAKDPAKMRYEDREREAMTEGIEGAVYKVYLDDSHPLAFGETETVFWMKRNPKTYPYLTENGAWTVGRFEEDSYLHGFVGHKLKPQIPKTLAFGLEFYGDGEIIYFTDTPVFRGFWHATQQLFANAVWLPMD